MNKLKRKYGFIALLIAVAIVSITVFSKYNKLQSQVRMSSYRSVTTRDKPVLYISPTYIPDSITLFGEKMKLTDYEVAERLEREILVNSYMHASTILYLKLSKRWFPIIEPILKRNGLPDDFKYLCVAESGLQQAISPSNAVGFWQFLSETGRQYNLEINDEVDERYHVEKATQAACDYLNSAYSKFGSWTNAAASYNMGQNGLQSRINTQIQNDYYELYVPRETMRYIFRIAALKQIMSYPELYGFILNESDYYSPIEFTTEYINHTSINWITYALSKNISYKDLRILNPWITSDRLANNSNRTYEVKIPIE